MEIQWYLLLQQWATLWLFLMMYLSFIIIDFSSLLNPSSLLQADNNALIAINNAIIIISANQITISRNRITEINFMECNNHREQRYESLLHFTDGQRDLSVSHYDDVIMDTIASQITSLTIVYSIVYSSTDLSKHQSSASLAFVWGIHRRPVNSPHKGPVTRKMFPFDDVIMPNDY